MKNNPLIDALAILLCLLAVIAAGHWFEVNKQQKESLQQNQKRVELVVDKKSFEYLNKRTE